MTKLKLAALLGAALGALVSRAALVISTERALFPSNSLAACESAMKSGDGFLCGLRADKTCGVVCGVDGVALEELLKCVTKGKKLVLAFDMRVGLYLFLDEIVETVENAGLAKDDVWFQIGGYGNIGATVAALGGHPTLRDLGTCTGQKALDELPKLVKQRVRWIITPFFADCFSEKQMKDLHDFGVKLMVRANVPQGASYDAALRMGTDAVLVDDAARFKAELANWNYDIPESPYVLYVGAGSPTVDMLVTNCAALEAEAPFDGLLFHLGATDVMGAKPLDKAKLDANIAKFKTIPFKRYRHNFLMTMIDRNDPKWFEDEAWSRFTENFRVAAAAAKDAGMDGLCFDPECYGGGGVRRAWNSSVHAQDGHTTNDCLRIARERGRQIGRAVFGEYPTMRFFSFYWWSLNADLMGAFCNGLLDVMPVSARLVDGSEWAGYVAKRPYSFKWHMLNNLRGWGYLDPKNEGKHVQVGETAPAFYLDAYADPKSGCILPEGKPRDRYFARNLLGAKRFSGASYFWMYGEAGTWWKSTTTPKRKLWEEKIPGITKVLFQGKGR